MHPSCQTLGVRSRQAHGYRVARNSSAPCAFAERLVRLHSEQARLASTQPRYFKPIQHTTPPPSPTCGRRALAASENRAGCSSRQLAGSEPVVVCGRLHESRKWLLANAALRHTPLMNSNASVLVPREAPRSMGTVQSLIVQVSVARQGQSAPRLPTPNPSIERTRTGRQLQAFISFWALRCPPARAAHVKR